jgi:Protein of unknown function (DUF3667)
MTDELAGAADIVTGAIVARAVEPGAGEAHGGAEGNCLNCGTALVGAHCHMCGQKGHVHRTLHAFGHDFLHSVLHFDGKIWRTLPMLFWNPGDLTRRYIHGERAKFVSPLALFLFTVFLTFAAFNWLVPSDGVDNVVNIEQADKRYQRDLKTLDEDRGQNVRQTALAKDRIAKAKADSEANITRLEAQLTAARSSGKPTKAIESRIESEKVDARVMGGALSALGQENGEPFSGEWNFTDLNIPGAASLNTAAKHAAENPQLLIYKMQSNAYKYSWALIPISVPFVWLLFFWRRRFKLFDHAVFVTYSLTFMMLLGVVCALLIQFPATAAVGGIALCLIPPIHMYRHLRHAYETSRFGAFWRMCLLSVFAMTALTLFAMLVVTLGVAG